MLWRYVGVTLVALGGAMLAAPAPEEEAGPAPQAAPAPAPEDRPAARAVQTAATSGAEGVMPAALELGSGTDGATGIDETMRGDGSNGTGRLGVVRHDTAARLDAAARDGTDGSVAPARPGGPDAVASATAPEPAEVPSLARPESLRPAEITAETLALIETAEQIATSDGPTDAAPEADLLYVTGSRVNVRSGPSTSYAVIGSTVYGETVELLSLENEAWAWVRFGDDRLGYMARSFLTQDLGDG